MDWRWVRLPATPLVTQGGEGGFSSKSMTRNALSPILASHYRLYHSLELRDIYKLLYQRVFGPEHSVDHLRAARERLYLEVIQLSDTLVAIPMFEPLSSVLCRVNLQPFIQAGGDPDRLWKVFCQTASDFQPGVLADLQRDWHLFRRTLSSHLLGTALCTGIT
jgi:hypothetical protein